jgi:hypothetical protein
LVELYIGTIHGYVHIREWKSFSLPSWSENGSGADGVTKEPFQNIEIPRRKSSMCPWAVIGRKEERKILYS